MTEKTELSMAIEQLRNSAHQILAVADWLEGSGCFAKSPKAPEKIPSAPQEPALTLEDVRAILAAKSRDGFTAQIRELLRKYDAGKLSEVDPSNYKSLVADAEALGDG